MAALHILGPDSEIISVSGVSELSPNQFGQLQKNMIKAGANNIQHIISIQQNYNTELSNNMTMLQAAGQNSVKLYQMFSVCIKITKNTLESRHLRKKQSFPATNNL